MTEGSYLCGDAESAANASDVVAFELYAQGHREPRQNAKAGCLMPQIQDAFEGRVKGFRVLEKGATTTSKRDKFVIKRRLANDSRGDWRLTQMCQIPNGRVRSRLGSWL